MTRAQLALALVTAVALTGCGAKAVPGAALAARGAAPAVRFTPGELNLGPDESILYMAMFQGTVKKVEAAGANRKIVTLETVKVDNGFFGGTLKLTTLGEDIDVAKVGATIMGQAHYPVVNMKTETWVNKPAHLAQGAAFKLVD